MQRIKTLQSLISETQKKEEEKFELMVKLCDVYEQKMKEVPEITASLTHEQYIKKYLEHNESALTAVYSNQSLYALAEQLNLNEETTVLANYLFMFFKEGLEGRKPSTLAALALDLSIVHYNINITRAMLCKETNISIKTL